MGRIIKSQCRTVENSKSIIGFENTGGGDWIVWDRYICIDGKKAYHIGNICGTCEFLFERMDGANQTVSPGELSHRFKEGLKDLEQGFLDKIDALIPKGNYIVSIMEIEPRMAQLGSIDDYFFNEQVGSWGIDPFWGLPHYPKVKYYRGIDSKLSATDAFYEFIIPMIPQNWLNEETINTYREDIKSGKKPTALAISVLDIKAYYDRGINHWCMAHYVIDGHHKVYASCLEGKPITLLSFLALGQGVSTDIEVEKLLNMI